MNDQTAPNPEQMRALAEWLDAFGAGTPQQAMPEELSDSADALRAAADQLEAVQSFRDDADAIADWLDSEGYGAWVRTDELARLLIRRYPVIGLTADTAPQEDSND